MKEFLYDVEQDMERERLRRDEQVQAGREKSDAELRAAGGIPLSARASVLLHHFSLAHTRARVASHDEMSDRMTDALTCSRRIIEYVGALEEFALLKFSEDSEDAPRQAIGIAAASIEGWIQNIGDFHQSEGTEPEEATTTGLATLAAVAVRLRIMEMRLDKIPGRTPAPLIVLPRL